MASKEYDDYEKELREIESTELRGAEYVRQESNM